MFEDNLALLAFVLLTVLSFVYGVAIKGGMRWYRKRRGKDEKPGSEAVANDLNFQLDLTTIDYLDVLNNGQIKAAAMDCIARHGIGSAATKCNAGSSGIHVELEAFLAYVIGTEAAVTFSHPVTASLAITRLCGKNDVIFCDEMICPLLQQAVAESHAIIVYFNHNDPVSLEDKIVSTGQMLRSSMTAIVEGIYAKTGKVCDLTEFQTLCNRYRVKLFVDESIALGVLGSEGGGALEYHTISAKEVHLVIGTLEGAVGSVGSFCAASKGTIEKLRHLSITPRLPVFQATTALAALRLIASSPEEVARLRQLSQMMHTFLSSSLYYTVQSDPVSPLKVFNYFDRKRRQHHERLIAERCAEFDVHLVAADYGLVMHLNVALYYLEEKLSKLLHVLQGVAMNLD